MLLEVARHLLVALDDRLVLDHPKAEGCLVGSIADRSVPTQAFLEHLHQHWHRVVHVVAEPIIDTETFERARELLAENRARTGNSIAPKDFDYVLQGILRCGACQTVLEGGSAKHQQYHYYRHPSGTKTTDCGSGARRAEFIEQAVLGRLSRLAEDAELLATVIEKANERMEDTTPEKTQELATARRRLEALQADHEGLVKNLMAAPPGSVPPSFWERAKRMEADIEAARAEVSRVSAELEDIHDARLSPQDYRAALQKFQKVYGMLDAVQQADLLAYLLDSVTVNKAEMTIALLGQTPEVAQIEMFTTEAGKYSQPSTWLRLRDSNPRPGG